MIRRFSMGLGVFCFLATLIFFAYAISTEFTTSEFTKSTETIIYMVLSAIGFAGSLRK